MTRGDPDEFLSTTRAWREIPLLSLCSCIRVGIGQVSSNNSRLSSFCSLMVSWMRLCLSSHFDAWVAQRSSSLEANSLSASESTLRLRELAPRLLNLDCQMPAEPLLERLGHGGLLGETCQRVALARLRCCYGLLLLLLLLLLSLCELSVTWSPATFCGLNCSDTRHINRRP